MRLDVWQVEAFAGVAHGAEGQPVRWLAPEDLPGLDFPAANRPIVAAVRLPDLYLVTGAFESLEDFTARLEQALDGGVRLVQLRAKALPVRDYRRLARAALQVVRARGARLLLNAEPALAEALGADGVHLSSARLRGCARRPLGREKWVAASVHNAEELRHAEAIGVDFAVLGPVAPTRTPPGRRPARLGGFSELVRGARLPVYALGGLGASDRGDAFAAGAQGVAAIRALWAAAGRAPG